MEHVSSLSDTMEDNFRLVEEILRRKLSEEPIVFELCEPLIRTEEKFHLMLFLLCTNAKEHCPLEKVLRFATAIELINMMKLVHNGITSEKKFPILVGDYFSAESYSLARKDDYATTLFCKSIKNICSGEIIQEKLLFKVPTFDEYYACIKLKTASFISSCCNLGAVFSNMDKHEVENLTAYGMEIGLAFQITNDVLNLFGDLKSGIITLPVIRALEVSEESSLLKKLVTSGKNIETAIEIIQDTDAVDYCKAQVKVQIDSARKNIPLTLKNSATHVLNDIADFVIDRIS